MSLSSEPLWQLAQPAGPRRSLEVAPPAKAKQVEAVEEATMRPTNPENQRTMARSVARQPARREETSYRARTPMLKTSTRVVVAPTGWVGSSCSATTTSSSASAQL